MLPHPDLPPGFRLISGKRAPTEGKYEVIFRKPYHDTKHAYERHQLNWRHEGHDWDVIAVKRCD